MIFLAIASYVAEIIGIYFLFVGSCLDINKNISVLYK
jgi:hypothetical protein